MAAADNPSLWSRRLPEWPGPDHPSELSSGDLASLLHMLDALVAKNRLKTLAGAP
jgi:hypothetical protein